VGQIRATLTGPLHPCPSRAEGLGRNGQGSELEGVMSFEVLDSKTIQILCNVLNAICLEWHLGNAG
jgi:hypothetical protein